MPDVLLFDIDGTLWNPRKREQVFQASLERQWGIGQNKYQEWLGEYTGSLPDSTFFNPDHWLSFLHGRLYDNAPPVEEKELVDLFYGRNQFLAALYPEVLQILTTLRKTYSIGCFSQGIIDFQMMKLELTGIYPLLVGNLLFISGDKTDPEYLKLLPASVIVDDRPDVIEKLRVFPHLRPVWLRRSDSNYAAVETASSEYLASIPVIATLEELPEVL